MQVGPLRERVTFQRRETSDIGGGAKESTWVDIGTTPEVWAGVFPLSGRERENADALTAEADYRVRVRYREDLDAEMRILWKGNPMAIRHIALDPRRQKLDILAQIGSPEVAG